MLEHSTHPAKNNSLLVTKIGIPRVRPDQLLRSDLLRRLKKVVESELILVSAPAGFGKTTLLASWANINSQAIAWLSLEADDNDPARFWRYVLTVIDRVHPGAGEPALSLLNNPAQPTLKALVTALVNTLAANPFELVLILDDYHWIESTAIHESLTFLLEHLPPGMHLIISSRIDPPFPLARFRASGQLAELRAADLRFTTAETADLLREVWKLNLADDSVTALVDRTEGWVTGLQLAALSLIGAPDPAQKIERFTGSSHYVLDYLTEEVLAQQPEEVRTFLLETSVLEQLCGPLCDALTGRNDGRVMLEMLERANLFLMPLEDEDSARSTNLPRLTGGGPWYRYHYLFADLLRSRLRFNHPEHAVELHRKAAAWFESEGRISSALRHTLAAGEALWAARLVEQHVEELLQHGEGETLRGWLAALPPAVVHAHPRLALAQALAAFNAGHLLAAEPLLKDAEQAFAGGTVDPYEPSIDKEMSMLVNVPASIALLRAALAALRGDAEQTTALAQSAQNLLAKDDRGPRISIRWNLAQADWMRGRLYEAERGFRELVAEGQETHQLHLMLTAGAVLGRIQRAQGRLEAAFRTYQECLAFAGQAGPHPVLSTAVAHEGMAEVLYERNQLNQALRHARESISLGRQLTSTQTLAMSLATMAWIQQALGNATGALEAMEEAIQVMPDRGIVSLHNPVPAERARLLLFQKEWKEVARWIKERGLTAEDESGYAQELEYLVLARYLFSRNLPDQALILLEHLFSAAKEQARVESIIKIQALQAVGLQETGKAVQSMQILAQALMQAETEGYMRAFVDEGQPMAALLHRASLRGVLREYTSSLLAAFPSVDGKPQFSSQPVSFPMAESAVQVEPAILIDPAVPVESLSERELEVLRLLSGGASNQEIAAQLSIALTTARKHVSNILGKLGVNNRTQAVARGRDLGLL